MNPTTAALVAALKSAIQFAEATWGPHQELAARTTAPWRAAIAAVSAPEESADLLPAVKFHHDQAMNLAGEVWDQALAIIDLAPGVEVSDVQHSSAVLTSSGAVGVTSNLPADQIEALLAAWHGTARRRRGARRLRRATRC